jgi:glycosyltransferase involved in cell wall biosynthesis
VGQAALLVAWKGQAVVLDAVALLPEIRCELAGGTLPTTEAYRDALTARAAQPDLAGRVRFLGHVDAIDTMRGWDVAVLASTSPEAGPLAVLEAMSLGLPVVATDHGGSAELLADGCGILVPPGDPAALAKGIAQALDDAVRPALAAASRQRVAAHHDRSRTLPAQYEAVVLGRRGA